VAARHPAQVDDVVLLLVTVLSEQRPEVGAAHAEHEAVGGEELLVLGFVSGFPYWGRRPPFPIHINLDKYVLVSAVFKMLNGFGRIGKLTSGDDRLVFGLR